MTTQLTTELMPAGTTQKFTPTQAKDRREVNIVALFDTRRDAKRASARLSDVEKAMRAKSVLRQRRQQADQAALLAVIHGLRIR